MKKIQSPVVGDKVGFNNPNLMNHEGVIVAIKKGSWGSDCVVKWTQGWPSFGPIESEECLFNLRRL